MILYLHFEYEVRAHCPVEIWKVRFTAYILTAINIEVRAVIDIIFGSLGKIFYFYASIVAAFRKSVCALVCFTLNIFSKISFTFDKVLNFFFDKM